MSSLEGKMQPTGELTMRVIRAQGVSRSTTAKVGLWWKIRNLRNVWPGLWRHSLAKTLRMNHMLGTLHVRKLCGNGEVIDYGLVSTQLVTDAFAEYMVDELQAETSEWGDFKFHDSGVGVTGAAVGDTDMETTDGESRVTGSQIEGATAEIYKSVGTITYSGGVAVTEHGLFSMVTGGTLMDRHVFGAINVVATDAIEFTYQFTSVSGA